MGENHLKCSNLFVFLRKVFSDILIKSLNLRKMHSWPHKLGEKNTEFWPSAKVQLGLFGHFESWPHHIYYINYNVVEYKTIIMAIWSKWNSLTENLLFEEFTFYTCRSKTLSTLKIYFKINLIHGCYINACEKKYKQTGENEKK